MIVEWVVEVFGAGRVRLAGMGEVVLLFHVYDVPVGIVAVNFLCIQVEVGHLLRVILITIIIIVVVVVFQTCNDRHGGMRHEGNHGNRCRWTCGDNGARSRSGER